MNLVVRLRILLFHNTITFHDDSSGKALKRENRRASHRTYSSGSSVGTTLRSVRSESLPRNSSLLAIGILALTSTRSEY